MADGDAPAYQLSFTGPAKDALRALRERAAGLGLLGPFARLVAAAERRLQTDPVNWGDPEARLQALGLMKYHAATPMLIFYYAVDEERRLVYVNAVKATPFQPLDVDD